MVNRMTWTIIMSVAGPVTSPPISSPTSTPAVTTTQVPGPSTTLLRDCPSSNNTLYSVDIGSVMSFRKVCNLSYRNSLGEDAVVTEFPGWSKRALEYRYKKAIFSSIPDNELEVEEESLGAAWSGCPVQTPNSLDCTSKHHLQDSF
jgi:hypothetical protein